MENIMKQTLLQGLPELKLALSEEQTDTLCAFGAAVVRQNQVMNLTAITEPAQVAKHLLWLVMIYGGSVLVLVLLLWGRWAVQ